MKTRTFLNLGIWSLVFDSILYIIYKENLSVFNNTEIETFCNDAANCLLNTSQTLSLNCYINISTNSKDGRNDGSSKPILLSRLIKFLPEKASSNSSFP